MTKVEMEKKALEAVGNWTKFDCFNWYDQPEDAENWCIVHTRTRDSEDDEAARGHRLEQSLKKFSEGKEPSVIITRFTHFAFGWVDAVAVKVFAQRDKMALTPAFKKLCQLAGTREGS